MDVKSLACLVALLLLLINHRAKGHHLTREELDYEKQFELLQKPSVKTIKNEYGDIYDCVDFYKQPAFDHPLLANHSFNPEVQMKPSTLTFEEESKISQDREVLTNMKSRGEGCPTGTIPIKRMSKDDFIKIKRFTKDYTSRTKKNSLENHFAVVQTPIPNAKYYYGAKAVLTVHNFNVSASQYSSAGVILNNGEETIQFGWTINPTINNDGRTRLFQYLNAGLSQVHCFNMLCPGFVNVNKDIPIDDVLVPMSKRGGNIYIIRFSIFKDPKDGNWWLTFGKDNTVQGFWPKEIFTGLSMLATKVTFGGEAYGPVDQPLPPIGNGYRGIADPKYSAFCHSIVVLDENLKEDNDPHEIETYYTDASQYHVVDYGWTNRFGRIMFYGGTIPQ